MLELVGGGRLGSALSLALQAELVVVLASLPAPCASSRRVSGG